MRAILFCILSLGFQNINIKGQDIVLSSRDNNDGVFTPYRLIDSSLTQYPLWIRGGRNDMVQQLTFIDNGNLLVSHESYIPSFVSREEGVVRINDFNSGKLLKKFNFEGTKCAISNSGQIVASETYNINYTHDLDIWDLTTLTLLAKTRTPGIIDKIMFSLDDHLILTAGYQNHLCLWNTTSGNLFKSFTSIGGDISAAILSNDASQIIARNNNSLKILDVHTDKIKFVFSTESLDPSTLAYSPDGKLFAFCPSDSQVLVMEVQTQKAVKHFSTFNRVPKILTFSPDSKRLLIGSFGLNMHYVTNFDGTITIQNIIGSESVTELSGHESAIFSSTFSPDGKFIVCGLENGTVPLWDASTGKMLRKDVNRISKTIATTFSADSKSLITFDMQGVIYKWQCYTGDSLSLVQSDKSFGSRGIFAPDKNIFIAEKQYGNAVDIISTQTGNCIKTLTDGNGEIYFMTISNSGKILVLSTDGRLSFWDLKKGKCFKKYRTDRFAKGLAFSNDNQQFAATLQNNKSIFIWQTISRKLPFELSVDDNCFPTDIMFSKEGNKIAATYMYGKTRIWDIKRRKVLHVFESEASCLAYSPGGDFLATADLSGVISIWNTKSYSLSITLKTSIKTTYTKLLWSENMKFILGQTEDGGVALWEIPNHLQ